MKKTITILISILVFLYVILSITGSSKEYAAEKLFYSAMKAVSKIAANPDVVPPKLVDYIENRLEKLLQKYPDTEVAKTADIRLTEFYIENKKYDNALKQAESMIGKYEKIPGILSMAHFLKGIAYEKQDRWPSALKEYRIIRDNYRDTQLGMQMPVYIANYYSQKGMDAKAQEAYGEAALFYENIEKENRAKPLGYMASLFLIQTYIKSGDYEAAGRRVGETLDKYFGQTAMVQLFPLVENIIVTKLNEPEKAIEIYKNIIERSKSDKLKKVLQKRVDELSAKQSS